MRCLLYPSSEFIKVYKIVKRKLIECSIIKENEIINFKIDESTIAIEPNKDEIIKDYIKNYKQIVSEFGQL